MIICRVDLTQWVKGEWTLFYYIYLIKGLIYVSVNIIYLEPYSYIQNLRSIFFHVYVVEKS